MMMKKAIFGLLISVVAAMLVTGCSSSDGASESVAEEEKVYLEDSQMDELFTDAEQFKGKYVKIPGKVLDVPEKDGDTTAVQLYYDVMNYEQSYIVYIDNYEEKLTSNDYVMVDGKVDGTFEGENLMGAELTVPLIRATSIEKSCYMDIVVPTIKTIESGVSASQNDCTVTVEKIEFAEKETRVYMSYKNDSAENVSFDLYGIRLIQDGKQIDQDDTSESVYEGDYETMNYEVSSGATTSGILVFPAIEQKDFQVIVPDNYSDDYEIEFKDFKLDVVVE